MNTSNLNKILFFLIIIAVGWNIYAFRNDFDSLLNPIFGTPTPCQKAITYSIGTIDPEFGVSKAEFLQTIEQAADIWGDSIDKDLFTYSENGELKISLIYDTRQAATLKLKQLGTTINVGKADYDKLKAEYETAVAEYNRQKADYQNQVNAYNAKKNYNQNEVNKLNQIQAQLNLQINSINQMAAKLNQMATILNLNVANYNGIGAQQGQEFEEGIYSSDASGEKIEIYQFENKTKLIRVIAHELGHALGIDHLNNPQAIMYLLNQSVNLSLTADDINALKSICKIES
ncbi:MAG: matrixin family metalloprotease [Candidatus Paceibacterota bacterium]